MDYFEVTAVSENPLVLEILTAVFAEIGFESFESEDNWLKAYIREDLFNPDLLRKTCDEYQPQFSFDYSIVRIPFQNWNAVWESNFQPVSIDHRLRIRAVFHDSDPSFPLEIVIQPKMSFGTGHHATTYLIMEAMLDLDFQSKKVMDFGSGTGILAILAHKLGSREVWATDNDRQCIE